MEAEEFLRQYNLSLTNQQLEAVKRIEGPTLLLAVPGSGKTTTLVSRLGYMIMGKGIAPEDILVLTYTNAATNDMSKRFKQFFGDEYAQRLEFRTINSVCQKIYAHAAHLYGRPAYELMDDTSLLISVIYREVTREFATETDIKDIKQAIGYIKNMMLSKEQIENELKHIDNIAEIYDLYCKKMSEKSAMDYDDQLVYAYFFLNKDPRVLTFYQNKYKYILVDEGQDTSKIQHEIIKLLAKDNENLFIVGDEDQSIYGFRAAYPEALLNFEKDHPNARVLLMEQNFRSTKAIVSASDAFIQKNISRHEKHMVATREEGNAIKGIPFNTRREQYPYLIKVAKEAKEEVAFLYRDNESALPLIDEFERIGIPYRFIGASKEFVFFSSKIVMDVCNIIRFAYDQYDLELFQQIYYKIKTYINKNKLSYILDEAVRTKEAPIDAAIRMYSADEESRGMVSALRHVRESLSTLKTAKSDRIMWLVCDDLGYEDFVTRSKMNPDKLFILKEIARNASSGIAFLSRLDYLSELVVKKEPDYSAKVLLSTFHSSKGLEYDNVYLMDVIDGLFPVRYYMPAKMRTLKREDLKEYEEERRLFYVAMTRARNNLYIFSASNSSFAKEVFGANKQVMPVQRTEDPRKPKHTRGIPSYRVASRLPQPSAVSNSEYLSFKNGFRKGRKISHEKYGLGEIIDVENEKVVITFSSERKTFDIKVLYLLKVLKLL